MTTDPTPPRQIPLPAPLSVAFCPCPPVLHPAVEGRATPETTALRNACAEAVGAALAIDPGTVVVVGPADPPLADLAPPTSEPDRRYGAGDAVGLQRFGLDVELPFAGPARPGRQPTPASLGLGGRLLDTAGHAGPRIGIGPGDLASVLEEVPGPVAVLALGDGSARRTMKAPGYLDEAAGPFDAAVAAALAAGDAAALAGLDAAEGERLLAAGVPVWRAVGAVLAGRDIAEGSGGRRIEARLLYDEAPLGVGYLVAHWTVG